MQAAAQSTIYPQPPASYYSPLGEQVPTRKAYAQEYLVPPFCESNPPPTKPSNEGIITAIQTLSRELLSEQEHLLQQNDQLNKNIEQLNELIITLKKKRLKSPLEAAGKENQVKASKAAKWMVEHQWLIWSSIALTGVVGALACEKIRLPGIPIKVIGSISINGGGLFIQKTECLRWHVPS